MRSVKGKSVLPVQSLTMPDTWTWRECIEGGGGVTCEPVIGEDMEVVAVREDGVWGFFGWVGIIAGAGFDAGDLLFEGGRGRGGSCRS